MSSELTAFIPALITAVQSPVVTTMIAVLTAVIGLKIAFWGVTYVYGKVVRLFSRKR